MKKYPGRIIEKRAKTSGGLVSKNTKPALFTILDDFNLFDDVEKEYTEQFEEIQFTLIHFFNSENFLLIFFSSIIKNFGLLLN